MSKSTNKSIHLNLLLNDNYNTHLWSLKPNAVLWHLTTQDLLQDVTEEAADAPQKDKKPFLSVVVCHARMQFLMEVLCNILESSRKFLDGCGSPLPLCLKCGCTFQLLHNASRALFRPSSLSCSSFSVQSYSPFTSLNSSSPHKTLQKNLCPRRQQTAEYQRVPGAVLEKAGLSPKQGCVI